MVEEKRIVITAGEGKDKILVRVETRDTLAATKTKELMNTMNLNPSGFEIEGKHYISSVVKLSDFKDESEYNNIAKKIMTTFKDFNVKIQKSKTLPVINREKGKTAGDKLPGDYDWM